MGSSVSTLLFSKSESNLDVPDSVLGLTKREKDSIRHSWDLVRKDIKGNGVELFLKFFGAHPNYQKMFSSFADVPLSELPGNKKLLAHATSVMYAFSSMVDNLEDPDCLKELISKIGNNHLPRAVREKEFADLAPVLMGLFEEKLGSQFTATCRTAWKKLFELLLSIVKDAQESTKKQQQPIS